DWGHAFEDLLDWLYEEAETDALGGVNLTVRAGEVLALVGRSGAGKTSLVDLIPRFFRPTSGRVLIDGHDISEVRAEDLRKQIGLVSQDIVLFDDTVARNIGMGREGSTPEELEAAARAAFAHDFIMELPEQYETRIGERGVMLSGGQRQRISIARAILKNPPILILDEATSALDRASELAVQRALENLMQNRTTFVIAHRLSTVRRADRIVVLDRGRVVEMGAHEELLAKKGVYAELSGVEFR
ncbi:MAG: ABC transporter ATP-binding protein, partial [Thermodesulfobacteriota bacterium]